VKIVRDPFKIGWPRLDLNFALHCLVANMYIDFFSCTSVQGPAVVGQSFEFCFCIFLFCVLLDGE
jgi:hypothetical protein